MKIIELLTFHLMIGRAKMLNKHMKNVIEKTKTHNHSIQGQRWEIVPGPDKEITDPVLKSLLEKLAELHDKEALSEQYTPKNVIEIIVIDDLEEYNGQQNPE